MKDKEIPQYEFIIQKYTNNNGLVGIQVSHNPTNLSLTFYTGLKQGQFSEHKLEKAMMAFLKEAISREINI